MNTDDPGRKATFPIDEAFPAEVPPGVDRRTFMMRSAMIGSAAVITGCTPSEKQQTAAASEPPPAVPKGVSLGLDVKRQTKGPGMTTVAWLAHGSSTAGSTISFLSAGPAGPLPAPVCSGSGTTVPQTTI